MRDGCSRGSSPGPPPRTPRLPGYNTALYYDTTTDTTVVVQTNSDIASGDCPADTPTLPANSRELSCSAPAARIFVALTNALGHPFVMP